MKKLFAVIAFVGLFMPFGAALADAPALQIHPLQYEDIITADDVQRGYIDVSNPSDATIALASSVQAFRQVGTNGQLEFFDDSEISAGITVDLTKFELGPREAIRVAFNVDPLKLPKGGVYAAIFFRTVPPEQASSSSYVTESANIGTLLLFQNGGPGVHVGKVTGIHLPFFQFGNGVHGTVSFANTNRAADAVGFDPSLTTRISLTGKPTNVATGLVLPSSSRNFAINRPGSYFGLLPVTATDTESGTNATAWIFVITGWYQPFLLFVIAVIAFVLIKRPKRLKASFEAWWCRHFHRSLPKSPHLKPGYESDTDFDDRVSSYVANPVDLEAPIEPLATSHDIATVVADEVRDEPTLDVPPADSEPIANNPVEPEPKPTVGIVEPQGLPQTKPASKAKVRVKVPKSKSQKKPKR